MQRHDDNTSEERPSLKRACARRVGLTLACTGMVAIASFAVLGSRLVTQLMARSAVDQARICAASLAASPNGDLGPSIERVRARYESLVAVASIGVTGRRQ